MNIKFINMKYDRSLEVIYEMEERIHKRFLSREYSRDNYIYIYTLQYKECYPSQLLNN